MPVGRQQQTNATLYALIVFVGLFIITTTAAVILYVKFEEYRKQTDSLKEQKNELATNKEWDQRGTIVGLKKPKETYVGKMVGYLDEMVSRIIGGPLEETSAEAKVDIANKKIEDVTDVLVKEYSDIGHIDPNSTGLIQIIGRLKIKSDNLTSLQTATKKQLNDLQNEFDRAMAASREKEKSLLAEKEKYKQQVDKIKQDYDDLAALMKKTTDQQVQTLLTQLDGEKANGEKLNQELLKTDAELKVAQDRLQKLQSLMPSPDREVAAYKPDGKIILVDDQAKIVHLDIGADNHVYPGLSFSVYDKSVPIPKDGKGKAEIEVFDVEKNFSAARITVSDKKTPIILDDVVANLVWDSDRANTFVVTGEFDLNDDGKIDNDAIDKIKALIKKWGGKIADTVASDVDFVVLGNPPRVLAKPTLEEMEAYPMAKEKYEASLKNLALYQEIQSQAQALSIPIFNTERFLYFIGYKSQAGKSTAF